MKSKLLILVSLISLTACSTASKSTNYASDEPELYNESSRELGFSPSKKLNDDEKKMVETRVQLKIMEDKLRPSEREQYYSYKSSFQTDEEKIEFLSVSGMSARDHFMEKKGLYYKSNIYSPVIKEAIQKRDIIMGMSKEAVIESWGSPQDVEVAGNALNGNERWKYSEYTSTMEGYQKEDRYVIFEQGKVAGWRRYQ